MTDYMVRTFPVGDGFISSLPSLVVSATFLVGFAILLPINWWAGMHYNTPIYSLTIVAGLVFEVIGYAGRILLTFDVTSIAGAVIYMLGTIMGPTFITSAVYQILPHIVVLYGKEFTLVSRPAYFSLLFVVFDLCTIAFQSVGVAVSISGATPVERDCGLGILLAGFALQMASITLFLCIYWRFIYKIHHRIYILDATFKDVYLSAKYKIFLLCMQLAIAFILVRTIVHFVWLLGGFDSVLSQSKLVILLLDATLVLTACIMLTLIPVGSAFGTSWGITSPFFCRGDGKANLPLHRRRGRSGPREISPPLPTALPNAYSPSTYNPGAPPQPPGSVNGSPGASRPPHGWAYGKVSQTSPGPSPSATDHAPTQQLVKQDDIW